MRRTSAALLMVAAVALGAGCDHDDNNRRQGRDDLRGERISHESHWDLEREREWDRHYRDRDWDRTHDRSADHLRDDHRGEGLMDRDQDRSQWDRRD